MARILTSAKIYLPLEHLKRKKDKKKQQEARHGPSQKELSAKYVCD